MSRDETSWLVELFIKLSLFILGLAGLVIACGVGAYKYKHRGNMSTSVFLMQLRVAAQGAVVSCLTLGLAYSMFDEYILHKKPPKV